MTKKQKKSIRIILISALLFAGCKLLADLFPPEALFGAYGRWVEIVFYLIPYLVAGFTVLRKAVRNLFAGRMLDENFLMAIATVGAFALGEYQEAIVVVILYRVGLLFESFATERSRRSIEELMDIMPEFANVERNGMLQTVDPNQVAVGEIMVIKAGERIPLDGKILEGTSTLNTAALTGESHPLQVAPGDHVISGSINQTGVLRVVVETAYENSTVGKVLELIEESATKKAKTESFITRFAAIYTPVVVGLAVLFAVVPPLVGAGNFSEWIERALAFLVSSCPCALVISVPLSFFGGMGCASRRGILVKGAVYLEKLAKMKTCLFDKTGTLTKGSFRVTAIHPEQVTEAELLRIAAAAECYSDHPISHSLVAAYGRVPEVQAENIMELPGAGIRATIEGKSVLVGNDRLMKLEKIDIRECTECHLHHRTGSTVHIAMDGTYMGHIVIADEIKEGAAETIATLKKSGIQAVMLTGDNQKTAAAVAETLGMDAVHAELLPDQKVTIAERWMAEKDRKHIIGFVGDGINDAPVLIRADVGISMGAMGSDAAIEAADIVIMDDAVSKITLARHIAKKTLRNVRQNIIFFITVKVIAMLLIGLGYEPMWLAIFADVGVTILATLNAMRCMTIHQK